MINQRVLLPLLFATLFAQPALAQINPFRNSSATPLNAADIAALVDAKVILLAPPQHDCTSTEVRRERASRTSAIASTIAWYPVQRQ